MEFGNHLSESLQTTLNPPTHCEKLSGNDQFNAFRPVAMEVATLIASSGGEEYEEVFHILTQLLHSWKLNRKVVLLELAEKSELTSLEELESDRHAAHIVDDDVMMVENECTGIKK